MYSYHCENVCKVCIALVFTNLRLGVCNTLTMRHIEWCFIITFFVKAFARKFNYNLECKLSDSTPSAPSALSALSPPALSTSWCYCLEFEQYLSTIVCVGTCVWVCNFCENLAFDSIITMPRILNFLLACIEI